MRWCRVSSRSSGGAGIEYGKIKLWSSTESVSELMTSLKDIMDKYNYPESVVDNQFDETPIEEPLESLDDEKPEAKQVEQSEDEPWAKLLKERVHG
jgi:hypothetical protein